MDLVHICAVTVSIPLDLKINNHQCLHVHLAVEDNVESKKEDKPSKEDEPKMFEITAVNGYGSQTLVRFEDDGSPLKLGGGKIHVTVERLNNMVP